MGKDDGEEKNEPTSLPGKKKLRYGLGASQTVHFSVALAEFINWQVSHFHPPLSESGFIPAAPQLNPPVSLLVAVVATVLVEGAGPNPVKLGLNADPVGLGAPKEKPDPVGIGRVELPNRSGPEGGIGMEKVFPESELEEVTPGLGVSQTVHFSLADAGFIKSQAPHFHPSVLAIGGFNPAAPQLNPPEPEPVEVVVVGVLPEPKTRGVEGGLGMENDGAVVDFSAPGFGVSHTVHFSVADVGFTKSQVPHLQPSASVVGGFNPAAPQLNPPEPVLEVPLVATVVVELVPKKSGVEGGFGIEKEGVTGLATPGLGVSHTVHFSAAEAGFIKSQVPHFHPSSCLEGGFIPARSQLNPPFIAGEGVVVEEVERGLRVEAGRVLVLLPEPVLLRLEGPAEVEERLQASSMEISSSPNPLTSFSALDSPELLPSLIVLLGSVKVSAGSSEMAIESTSALAFLGEVAAVGDTEDAEEAVSSLSALILKRNFEGSLGADDLRPKKDLPAVVGEIVGCDEEDAPLRPAVCN